MKPHSRTWNGQASSDTVTLQDLLECCHVNIREAAKREGELRDLYNRLPPGDPRLTGTAQTPPISCEIVKAQLEQAHWREYQQHYLQRIALEGKDRLVRLPLLRGQLRLAPPPVPKQQPDPRLPREPGEDDDGEELPF